MRNNSHCKSVNQTERYAKKTQPTNQTNILSCAGNLAVRARKYKRSNIMQLGQNMGKVIWKTSIHSRAGKKIINSNKRQNHKLRPLWENKSLINHWCSEFGDDKHGVNTDNVVKVKVLENRCTYAPSQPLLGSSRHAPPKRGKALRDDPNNGFEWD